MLVLLLVSLAMLGYVLVGYPALLRAIVRLRGPRTIAKADITPPLSLVISAYNEAAVIREKLTNAVSLDYPADRRQIVVVSDCSNDGTDEIVREFAAQGVELARMAERRGKTAGLNAAVPTLTGDIVVFSDANAIYEPDSLRKLARNFADPTVGYATGEARYLKKGETAADIGERAYWDYEIQMKRLETQLGSMVGGDGAIYAIRRSLWQSLPEDAINDFLNPLQIVGAGWRGVYEPEAVCWEETGGGSKSEYKRRVRIVSRSWRAVFQAPNVLNPLKVGLFAWSLWSHKVLRWLAGFFLVGLLIGGLGVYVETARFAPTAVAVLTLIAAAWLVATQPGRRLAGMGVYFGVINAASVVGIYRGTIGRVSGVWSTPRETAERPALRPLVPTGRLFLAACGLGLATIAIVAVRQGRDAAWPTLAISVGALLYVYVLYPLILMGLRLVMRRPHTLDRQDVSVCVFIAANDEAAVIEAKIRNTLDLDYPEHLLEIIVASDGSVDGTNDIVRRFAPQVRLLEYSPRRGKIATIIRGVHEASSDIVVFSDANTFLDPDAVQALVRNFADPTVGCVSGDVILIGDRAMIGRSEDLYYRYERWLQNAESAIGSMIGADGALYAIRRHLFEAPPPDTILDDMAIPMAVVRQGYRSIMEPLATAHEQGVGTAREEFWRKSRVIAGAIQFLSRHDSSVPVNRPLVMLSLVSHKALRWLTPVFALGALGSTVVLAGTSAVFATVALGQALVLVMGLAGCVPALRRLPFVGLAHYCLLVLAAAGMGFLRGLSGRQSVLWRRFMRPPVETAG